jgi:hypothetical protein
MPQLFMRARMRLASSEVITREQLDELIFVYPDSVDLLDRELSYYVEDLQFILLENAHAVECSSHHAGRPGHGRILGHEVCRKRRGDNQQQASCVAELYVQTPRAGEIGRSRT